MNFEYQPDDSDEADDLVAQQALDAQAKYGAQPKSNKPQEKKKQFDSADHFSTLEKMRQGGGQGGSSKIGEQIEEEKE